MLGSVLKIGVAGVLISFLAVNLLLEVLTPAADDAAPAVRAASAAAPVAGSLPVPGSGRVTLSADALGHFTATADIGGRKLPVLVDTGASAVAIRYEDARDLGLVNPSSRFDVPISTANGVVRAAKVELRSVRIGGIEARRVEALVPPQGALATNLLGMTFLNKLSRFEVASGRLVLEE